MVVPRYPARVAARGGGPCGGQVAAPTPTGRFAGRRPYSRLSRAGPGGVPAAPPRPATTTATATAGAAAAVAEEAVAARAIRPCRTRTAPVAAAARVA
ncbi:hypothetical protein [Streptomyces sp. A475]|uniref:hypothetical protein n=1 Tax=Streptomyces sp. A475 TaxID=3131976 RepID=UPI0030EDCFFA